MEETNSEDDSGVQITQKDATSTAVLGVSEDAVKGDDPSNEDE
ncbi:hypothetical protein TNCT_23081, partial [Trichonephila clavata]